MAIVLSRAELNHVRVASHGADMWVVISMVVRYGMAGLGGWWCWDVIECGRMCGIESVCMSVCACICLLTSSASGSLPLVCRLPCAPDALGLVRRPVRHLALLATIEDDEATRALLEARATASGLRAVRARLQVRGLLGGGSTFFRDLSRRVGPWMR
jgi:hypothetical protein